MRGFVGAFRLQLQVIRQDVDYLMPLITTPLFAIVLLAIVREAGRADLTDYALIAPIFIGLWSMALATSGDIVESDRWYGTLEPSLATPTSPAVTVVGRVFAVTIVSAAIASMEVGFVARVLFHVSIEVHHPLAFALAVGATIIATAGTAIVMAALFVLTRTARTFQNSLSFPFYVLGGVMVPVSFLPGWLQGVSKAVFLSWSADLLRDSLQPAPVSGLAGRVAMITLLGVAGFVIGRAILHRFLRRLRSSGSTAFA